MPTRLIGEFQTEGYAPTLPFRVRWAECDAAGIIYHAHVFDWFSEGRVAWLEGAGLSYYKGLRPLGLELLVLDCRARFHLALSPGDAVALKVLAVNLTPTRLDFLYSVTHGEHLAVEGMTRHVFVRGGKPVNMRKAFPSELNILRRVTGHAPEGFNERPENG